MATAALTTSDLRIVPISQASLAGVESLLAGQCREWLALLRWDYTGPNRMKADAIRSRELEGFAAAVESEVAGIAFYVVEGHRCSVGDTYVSTRWRGLGIDGSLAEAILGRLEALPGPLRIESQGISVDNDAAVEAFRSRGFEINLRHYMAADPHRLSGTGAIEFEEVSIRHWKDDDFSGAAFVIHKSYSGESDSLINSQYQSEEGCAELVSILTEHVWCGQFMPRVSRVAVSKRTGKPVGVLLASKIANASGHIGQISILPSYQGRGLGRAMIGGALSAYKQRGFESVSLAVTATNTRALRLYESWGFHTAHIFPVFYLDR